MLFEVADLLGGVVFEESEVALLKIVDGDLVFVGDGDVDDDEAGVGFDRRSGWSGGLGAEDGNS